MNRIFSLKLTPHYINQIEYISKILNIGDVDIIGYIVVDNCQIGLGIYNGDYFKLKLNIEKSEQTNKAWWSTYQILKQKALETHIYYAPDS